jgi:hypothetical protein
MSAALNRLKARLAQNTPTHATAETVKSPSVGFDGGSPRHVSENQPSMPDPDDFAERAALIEFDGRIPQPFADALAAIMTAGKPVDMPTGRWMQFQIDASMLADEWSSRAIVLGWTVQDFLGTDPVTPWARIDRLGLAWLMNGAEVIAMDTQTATLQSVGRTRQTFTRRKFE